MSAPTVHAAVHAPLPGTPALPGLAPLRDALLAGARAEAARIVADAEAEAAAVLAQAGAWVDARVEEARERGRAEGAERLEGLRMAARRAARERVLRARAEVHADLVRQARTLVAQLLANPGRRRGLEARLRSQLGPGAVVSPTADGGLAGRDDAGRAVDASVGTLVDDALAGLDLEDLWTPG